IKITFFGIILSTLLSCTASFGEKYTLKNLDIYYTPPGVSERHVEKLARYFDENDLIQNKQHSIQLTSDHQSYIMKIVLDKEYKALHLDQSNSLVSLEKDIDTTVFDGLNFRIVVCTANLFPIKSDEINDSSRYLPQHILIKTM